jgi:hypothetical protein
LGLDGTRRRRGRGYSAAWGHFPEFLAPHPLARKQLALSEQMTGEQHLLVRFGIKFESSLWKTQGWGWAQKDKNQLLPHVDLPGRNS